jgi:hypothetical protein
MRSAVLLAALCLVAPCLTAGGGAAAQNNPPLQEMQNPSSQDSLLPPSLRNLGPRAPSPSAPLTPSAPFTPSAIAPQAPSVLGTPDAQGVAPPDMTPQVPWPNKWQPATAAKIQALDKVNAQAGNLTVKVGQSATFETLTITVKACLVRPPDQPSDATAFLEVTDNHPEAPGFTGWMLANAPAVSMMQSPLYDIRVVGCS